MRYSCACAIYCDKVLVRFITPNFTFRLNREWEREREWQQYFICFSVLLFLPAFFARVYKSYSYLIRIKHFFLYSDSNFSKSNCCWFYFRIRLSTILFKKININIRKLFSVQKIEIRLIMKWRSFYWTHQNVYFRLTSMAVAALYKIEFTEALFTVKY